MASKAQIYWLPVTHRLKPVYSEKNRMFGTVGSLLKEVEVKIAADGEILIVVDIMRD